MSEIINGFEFAKNYRLELKEKVQTFKANTNKEIGLAVVLVGENPASQIYVRNKEKAATEIGITSYTYKKDEDVSEKELLELIERLNQDEKINAILVQLPLPKGLDETKILNAILPQKDVDGFHPLNLGKLISGQKGLVACTPKGCLKLLQSVEKDLSGLNAVVVGRSVIVGKPMAQLLLKENCTVTTVHSKTKNIEQICAKADILVVAIGVAKMVKNHWVKENAIVIDVGINRLEDGKLSGDVDFDDVFEKCRAITPVPKGVGPMTIAMLLENTIEAFCWQNQLEF